MKFTSILTIVATVGLMGTTFAAPHSSKSKHHKNSNKALLNVQQDDSSSSSSPYLYDNMDTIKLKDEGFRLIATSETHREWMSESDILNLIRANKKFMDVTDQDLESVSTLAAPKVFGESSLQQQICFFIHDSN
jgi:hypothetical protein